MSKVWPTFKSVNYCPMYFIYPMKAVMTKEYDATLVRLLMNLHEKNIKLNTLL